MLSNKNDSTYKSQWNFTLNELSKIYSLCKSQNIKVILLIFPYTFQFNNANLSWAQQLLIKHANENGVHYIDFLQVFENKMGTNSVRLKKYFLDEDHFTPFGHQIVAQELGNVIIGMFH